MFTPAEAKDIGFVDELCTEETALVAVAEELLRKRFLTIPRIARSEFKAAQRNYVVKLR